jgi:kynureninase
MKTDTPETDAETWKAGDLRIGSKVCADFARKLERQRDEAREYADKLAEGLPDGMLPKDVEVLREANLGLATELATVTAQRDRLAEALRKVSRSWNYVEVAQQALQSLTLKP